MIRVFVVKTPIDHDHDEVRFEIDDKLSGSGFISKKDGQIGLTRCPACNRGNYSMSVLLGICAWCGFSINHQGGIEIIYDDPETKKGKIP